jgi:hypothetical protein
MPPKGYASAAGGKTPELAEYFIAMQGRANTSL